MGVLLSFAISIFGEILFLAIDGKAITVKNIVANTKFYDFNYYIIYFALLIGYNHFWIQHYENVSVSKKIIDYVVFFTACSIIPFIARLVVSLLSGLNVWTSELLLDTQNMVNGLF